MSMKKKIIVSILAVSLAFGTLPGIPVNVLNNNGVAQAAATTPLASPELLAKMNAIHAELTDGEKVYVREARAKLWALFNASIVEGTDAWTKISSKSTVTSTELLDIIRLSVGFYYDPNGAALNAHLQYVKPALKKLAVGGANSALTEEASYTAAIAFISAVEAQITEELNAADALTIIITALTNNTDLSSALKSAGDTLARKAITDIIADTSLTFSGILREYNLTADDILEARSVFTDAVDSEREASKALTFAYARTKAALTTSSASNSTGTLNLSLSVFGKAVPSGLITWTTDTSGVSITNNVLTNGSDGSTVTASVKATDVLFNKEIFTGNVTVTNETETVTPAPAPAPTPAPAPPEAPSIPTLNKVITTPKVTVTIVKDEDGVEVTVVKLDKEDFKKQLAESKEAKAFVIPVTGDKQKAKAVLQVQDVEDASTNNKDNEFVVQGNGAEYSLPSTLLKSSELGTKLGISETDARNAEVEVTIEEKPETAVEKGKSKLVSKVVDFTVTVTSGGNSLELNDFGNTYVDRAFDLTQNVTPAKAVGVVVNTDGTISPVPTEFVDVGGKKVAVLKRNSNSSYTVVENDVAFTDIDNHWAEEDILLLGNKLIVSGYEDGSFMPKGTIKRGEFITLIARSLGFDTNNSDITKFSDVSAEAYYAGALKALVDQGLINGYADGTFKPDAQISRQDVAVILGGIIEFLELQNAESGQAKTFKDSSDISSYAANAIEEAAKLQIINGYEDNSFKPKAPISRAEAVIMIEKLLENANFISKN